MAVETLPEPLKAWMEKKWARPLFLGLADALLVAFSLSLAYLLRWEFAIPTAPDDYTLQLKLLLPWVAIGQAALFALFGLNRGLMRFASVSELRNILIASLAGLALLTVFSEVTQRFTYLGPLPVTGFGEDQHVMRVPRSILVIFWLLQVICVGGLRFSRRLWISAAGRRFEPDAKRVILIGAGQAGESLARSILSDPAAGLRPVAFLTRHPEKVGGRIHNLPVAGTLDRLADVIARERAEEVIVAMENVEPQELRAIVAQCETAEVRLNLVPSLREVMSGRVSVSALRPVSIEDLLAREPVRLELPPDKNYLKGERVLITGAGGSIGSELCRQALGYGPEQLILVGKGENSLYEIFEELRSRQTAAGGAADRLTLVVADARDAQKMTQVFERHKPTLVIHAAAHKHVPLMEMEPDEAIKNNVVGTAVVAHLASRFQAKKFILISTDKAVSPASVMGATKRVAEQIVFSLARESKTLFCAVRFGNVLGSRGSVIPLFRRQIERGGPVTVTSPEATRYFMTIPEAVSLILQAGAQSESPGGRLFVLDMGEPVKILDLARNLIILSGLKPDKDIRIEFTGLRPGERLHEDLLTASEGLTRTELGKLLRAEPEPAPEWALLKRHVALLAEAADEADPATLRGLLACLVAEYNPQTEANREEAGRWLRRAERTETAPEAAGAPEAPAAPASGEEAAKTEESADSASVSGEVETAAESGEAPAAGDFPAAAEEPDAETAGRREPLLGEQLEIEVAEEPPPAGAAPAPAPPEKPAPSLWDLEGEEPEPAPASAASAVSAPSSAPGAPPEIEIAPPDFLLLYPIHGASQPLEPLVESLRAQKNARYRLLLLDCTRDGLPLGHPARRFDADARISFRANEAANLAQCVNGLIAAPDAPPYLLAIPPRVTLPPDALQTLGEAFEKLTGVAAIFPDYYRLTRTGAPEPVALLDWTPGVIHERHDYGYLTAWRTEAMRAVQGMREDLEFAAEYDLMLRLTAEFAYHRLATPLYVADELTGAREGAPGLAGDPLRLRAPGEPPLGGLERWNYPPEMEAEFRAVFEQALQRRGLWIEPRPEPVIAPAPVIGQEVAVTVIVPAFNAERFLENAVQKVLHGIFQDLEVLIVDWASADGTRRVAQRLMGRDRRVRLVAAEGASRAAALNQAARRARGRYLAFLEADDEFSPDGLDRMITWMRRRANCALAVSRFEFIDETGARLAEREPAAQPEITPNSLLRLGAAGPARVVARAAFEAAGLFNETLCAEGAEDYDLALRLSERFEIGIVDAPLYRCRLWSERARREAPPAALETVRNHAREEAMERRRAMNRPAAFRRLP